MPLDVIPGLGTMMTQKKSARGAVLRLQSSMGGRFWNGERYQTIGYRTPGDVMGESVPLFTGDTDPIGLDPIPATNPRIWLSHNEPFPITVVAMSLQIEIMGYQ